MENLKESEKEAKGEELEMINRKGRKWKLTGKKEKERRDTRQGRMQVTEGKPYFGVP